MQNNVNQTRRQILKYLYKDYYREWDATHEEEKIATDLRLPLLQVRGALKYLIQKELVTANHVQVGARQFVYVRITAQGIDLIEDESEFNRTFPPQIVYQYIAGNQMQVSVRDNATYVGGDLIQATIGDNVSHVAIGKDIVQIAAGATASLTQLTNEFCKVLEQKIDSVPPGENSLGAQIGLLQQEIQKEEPNLGTIQQIKQFLAHLEGNPAPATAALFSHPAVVNPIRRAVEHLIGHS